MVVSWSGGKDSTLVLDRLARAGYDVRALVTTVDAATRRVSAHGVREELVAAQAASLGVPLVTVALPERPDNGAYLERFAAALAPAIAEGVTAIAFGDIFLEDLRAWRERSFAAMNLRTAFPLWGEPSRALADEFFARGFASVLCCVSDAHLDATYLGRTYDDALVRALPADVDRCGENGEFHTFAFDGPLFARPVGYALGAFRHERATHGPSGGGHWYADLRPIDPARCPLCAGDNACALAGGAPGADAAECWCFTEPVAASARERVPTGAKNAACICPACAREGV